MYSVYINTSKIDNIQWNWQEKNYKNEHKRARQKNNNTSKQVPNKETNTHTQIQFKSETNYIIVISFLWI